MKEFNKVIFGATAFCAGLSEKLDSNDLIIEKNIFCCAEFSASLNAKPISFSNDYDKKTTDFLKELKTRNILDEKGRYSAIPLGTCMAQIFLNQKATVLFDCTVTSVKKCDDGFVIEYFCEQGFKTVFASKIIDTTDIGVFGELEATANKYFLANVDFEKNDSSVLKGRFENEGYLKIEANGLNFLDAHKSVVKKADELNAKILSFSPVFAFEYQKPVFFEKEKNYYLYPSASYPDFAVSFDSGLKAVFY